eukprot:2363160-Amphidinium_carterae.1
MYISTSKDYYYRYRSLLEQRPGPSVAVNSTSGINYEVRSFRAPGLLLAPPLLLQSRQWESSSRFLLRNAQNNSLFWSSE